LDLSRVEQRALRDRWLHEKGYRYCASGRIGDLTPRQLNLLRLGDAIHAHAQQTQADQQANRDSISHQEYDVTASRQEAFR
jgi:hypothetical protein